MFSQFALSCGYDFCSIHPIHFVIWLVVVVFVLRGSLAALNKQEKTRLFYVLLMILVVLPVIVWGFIQYTPSSLYAQQVSDTFIDPDIYSCPSRFCSFGDDVSISAVTTTISAAYVFAMTKAVRKISHVISKRRT